MRNVQRAGLDTGKCGPSARIKQAIRLWRLPERSVPDRINRVQCVVPDPFPANYLLALIQNPGSNPDGMRFRACPLHAAAARHKVTQ